jgi:hypothetical protein
MSIQRLEGLVIIVLLGERYASSPINRKRFRVLVTSTQHFVSADTVPNLASLWGLFVAAALDFA